MEQSSWGNTRGNGRPPFEVRGTQLGSSVGGSPYTLTSPPPPPPRAPPPLAPGRRAPSPRPQSTVNETLVAAASPKFRTQQALTPPVNLTGVRLHPSSAPGRGHCWSAGSAGLRK